MASGRIFHYHDLAEFVVQCEEVSFLGDLCGHVHGRASNLPQVLHHLRTVHYRLLFGLSCPFIGTGLDHFLKDLNYYMLMNMYMR